MATINTTPTIPTGIDILADKYVQDHASEIYPILSYVREHYGKFDFSQLSEAHKIATLTVVEHATRYGTFKTTFQLRHSLLGAIQHAERRLTCTDNGGPRPEHRAIYASLLGKLAFTYAASFVEYPADIPAGLTS